MQLFELNQQLEVNDKNINDLITFLLWFIIIISIGNSRQYYDYYLCLSRIEIYGKNQRNILNNYVWNIDNTYYVPHIRVMYKIWTGFVIERLQIRPLNIKTEISGTYDLGRGVRILSFFSPFIIKSFKKIYS